MKIVKKFLPSRHVLSGLFAAAGLLLLAAPGLQAQSQVEVDAVSSVTSDDLTSISLSHTVGSESGRLLLVMVGMDGPKVDQEVTSVTYGGSALTELLNRQGSDEDVRAQIFQMVSPPEGTATVEVTFSDKNKAAIGVMSFHTVDTSDPHDGPRVLADSKGESTSGSVTSSPEELVMDFLVTDKKITGAGSRQTIQWQKAAKDGGGDESGGSTARADSDGESVPLSWTMDAEDDFIHVAFNLKGGDVTAPSPPTSVTAEAVEGGDIDVGFPDVDDGTTEYRVKRSTDGCSTFDDEFTVTDDDSSSYTFTDNGLTDGTTYCYVVTAVDDSGNESDPSNEATATSDGTPPVLEAATVNGDQVTLTYDEALDEGSVPPTTVYDVTGSSTGIQEPTGVSVSGTEVTLTLGTPVEDGETVSLDYVAPSSNPVQDDAGNDASDLDGEPLDNQTDGGDETAPSDVSVDEPTRETPRASTSAAGGRTTLDVGYSYTESNPSSATITLDDGSGNTAVFQVDDSGYAGDNSTKRVTLDLTSPDGTGGNGLQHGSTYDVRVAATDAAGNGRSATGADLLRLDNVGPELESATVDGDRLTLDYDEPLDEGASLTTGEFTVRVNGSSVPIASVSASGDDVVLVLSSAVSAGDAVELDYTPGSTIQDEAGNDADPLTGQDVTNNTGGDTDPPVLESATVDGSDLMLDYDEPLDEGSVPSGSAYTVLVNGSEVSVSSVSISGDDVNLDLSSAVQAGDDVALDYTPPGTDPVQDESGNDAGPLDDEPVTNNTSDTTPPVLESATVEGDELTLTYDETLDGNSEPPTSSYAVEGSSTGTQAPTSVIVSGREVTLRLGTPVEAGEQVALDYSVPGTDPVQDEAGNDAGPLSGETVTNNTADTTPPVLESATVDGSALTLDYDEPLDEGSEPSGSAYTVLVNGSEVSVSSVSVSDDDVGLTLSSAVEIGDDVALDYTPPGTDPVQDESGNDAGPLDDEPVTNTTSDDTPPVLQSSSVDGDRLTLTYDEALDEGSVPATSAYSVEGSSTGTQEPTDVGVSGSTVTLTLGTSVEDGETVALDYAPPSSNPVQDLAGNDAGPLTDEIIPNNTADTRAPVLESATVTGDDLALDYDEILDGASEPSGSAYTVLVNGSEVSVSSVSVSGDDVNLDLSSAVEPGDDVALDYTPPSTNPVQDEAGNDAGPLDDEPVTNNTSDTEPPTLESSSVDGDRLTLTYDEALDEGSMPATSAYTVEGSSTGAQEPTGVSVDGSTVTLTLSASVEAGETVTLDYTPPDTDPVQDLAGNDAGPLTGEIIPNNTGPGPASGAMSTITANPGSILADGSSTSRITVILRDAGGNRLESGGDRVGLSSTAGALSGVTDERDGTYTAALTSATEPSLATVSGTVNGEAIADSAEVAFTAESSSRDPDLRDTSVRATNNKDGTYTVVLVAPTRPVEATLVAFLNGEMLTDRAAVSFTASSASVSGRSGAGASAGGERASSSTDRSEVTVRPSTLPADGSTGEVMVTVRDERGRLASGDDSVRVAATFGRVNPATQFEFSVQPSNTEAGASVDPPVEVRALDEAGNVVTGYRGKVEMSLAQNPTGGSLSGTLLTEARADSGVATYSDLSIDTPGEGYRLRASRPDLNDIASATSDPFAILGEGQGDQADLSVDQTVSEPSPTVGDTITFTVRVRNRGPADATGVVIRDALPDGGVQLLGAEASKGDFDASSGRWSVGELRAEETATLELRVRVLDRPPQTQTQTSGGG